MQCRRLVAVLVFAGLCGAVAGQTARHARPFAANVIIPQSRAFPVHSRGTVQITRVTVKVDVVEQVATTQMDVALHNPLPSRLEAEIVVPVPEGAVVRGFDFEGRAAEPTAEVLPRGEAESTYERIVAQVRDPALLEFLGHNIVRSSVFPVEANGTQTVRLIYENILEADGDRVDYFLPRSDSFDYTVPWDITVRIRSARAIATVYSPSHELVEERDGNGQMTICLAEHDRLKSGPFRLSYLLERNGVTATLLAYPGGEGEGGYFLLLAGLPHDAAPESRHVKRDVTLVLDRSGSMNGEKLDQAREAARQIIAGLDRGETFNIIAYNQVVEPFSEGPVAKSRRTEQAARDYLDALTARGGTNIHDALLEALRPRPADGMLPIILFLTDGLPTIGETSERAIRNVAIKANPHGRRVFTFGVGVDVNAPLLDRIAAETRASAFYVLPGEDVEVKVARVFEHLRGPVLTAPELSVVDNRGRPEAGRTCDVIPGKLPDLFEGDQLIVLGRYLKDEPLYFELAGRYLGEDKTFRFEFPLKRATTRNSFVGRLWASRQIAFLAEEIRQQGADGNGGAAVTEDSHAQELIEEIVRLSLEFGILTEYTAFLAREGTDLSAGRELALEVARNLEHRAVATRSGRGAVNQALNIRGQVSQVKVNPSNAFLNAQMQQESYRTFVGQPGGGTDSVFRKGGRWVDARLPARGRSTEPEVTVRFGTPEYMRLARRLAAQGRQGAIAYRSDVVIEIDGKATLFVNSER